MVARLAVVDAVARDILFGIPVPCDGHTVREAKTRKNEEEGGAETSEGRAKRDSSKAEHYGNYSTSHALPVHEFAAKIRSLRLDLPGHRSGVRTFFSTADGRESAKLLGSCDLVPPLWNRRAALRDWPGILFR